MNSPEGIVWILFLFVLPVVYFARGYVIATGLMREGGIRIVLIALSLVSLGGAILLIYSSHILKTCVS